MSGEISVSGWIEMSERSRDFDSAAGLKTGDARKSAVKETSCLSRAFDVQD